MHYLWQIAELNTPILAFCPPKTALSLGLTAKYLLEGALDRVWSQIQLEHLVECLPRDVWEKWEDMNGEMMGLGWYWRQKRALTQAEFNCVLYYSKRVHMVTLGWERWIEGSFFHSPDGKQPLTIFPHLHSASFCPSYPERSNWITEIIDLRLFLGSSVSSLTLNLTHVLSNKPTGPYALFLKELATLSPNLHRLHLTIDEWNSNIVADVLSQITPSFRHLESFKVNNRRVGTTLISQQVLQHIADLETLKELDLSFLELPQNFRFTSTSLHRLNLKSLGQHSLSGLRNLAFLRIENVSKSGKVDFAPVSLPSLRQCWVSGDPSFCAMLVGAAEGSPLSTLVLRMEQNTISDHYEIPLIKMLTSIGRSTSLERLTLKGSARSSHICGPDDFLTLRECSSLVKLQIRYNFRLNDADWNMLLPCWPALKILKLGQKNHGNTSLRAFETIAQHSPRLECCHMPFKTYEVPVLRNASTSLPTARLEDLITMDSEIESDAQDIAEYLMALFPELYTIAARLEPKFCQDDYISWYEKTPVESEWDDVQKYLDER
ncbi:hypothetical protein DL96DRAFT_1549676 [Flagelloscypha sp. PMI_526]|nr:hypothetical protein DL96DRAFT_1549676 [Flagelloscypha sp. PMI_526]